MRIDDVRIGTGDVDAAAAFYRDVLDLPVSIDDGEAVVSVGRSTITLVPGAGAGESNHLAFTIPRNESAAAEQWLAERTDLLAWNDGESRLVLGEPWESESLYFYGPDGVILELITRGRLDNDAEGPFTSAHLLCVSEVGLATDDVAGAFAAIRGTFGVETFAGESPHFTTAGDQDGILILVTTGRPWFPTRDTRAVTPVEVTISGVDAGAVSDAGWTVRSSAV
jgi:catechol-2,3-dioxygenase